MRVGDAGDLKQPAMLPHEEEMQRTQRLLASGGGNLAARASVQDTSDFLLSLSHDSALMSKVGAAACSAAARRSSSKVAA